jgi:hypothetical protein
MRCVVHEKDGFLSGRQIRREPVGSKVHDDEVRRKYQDFLASAGISENRVATEVLYWLPHEFMEGYRELFHQALILGDGTKSGVNRLGENVVRKVTKERGKNGSMRATGAKGPAPGMGGGWVIRDERALEVKRRVDRALVSLIGRTRGRVYGREGGSEREKLVEREGGAGRGVEDERGLVTVRGGGHRKCCRTCGKLAGNGWVICPFNH